MTLVLIGKDFVLEGSTTQIEDKQVPGMYKEHQTESNYSPTILGSFFWGVKPQKKMDFDGGLSHWGILVGDPDIVFYLQMMKSYMKSYEINMQLCYITDFSPPKK